MTSDAAEYREQHRIRIIDEFVKSLYGLQNVLHRVFGDVVGASAWSPFQAKTVNVNTDPTEWDMIVNNPQQLGQSILSRQKADVDHAALVLGEALLKHTGTRLVDMAPEMLRDHPKDLGKIEMSLEQISDLLKNSPQDSVSLAVVTLHEGVIDMVNDNASLSAQAARSFGFQPAVVDADEKRLEEKVQLLNVAQMWATLAMLETRVMRTALILDMALEKKGIVQDRNVTNYRGRLVL